MPKLNCASKIFLLKLSGVVSCLLMSNIPVSEAFAQETPPAEAQGAESLESKAEAGGEAPVTTPEATSPQEAVRVSGQILIRGTGAPIQGVLVFDPANRRTNVKSDEQGRFSIEVPSTVEKLGFRRAGFDDLEIQLKDGRLVTGAEVFLERGAGYREVGIIRAKRKTEVSQQSIDKSELENLAGARGDAVKGLQSLPSVLPTGAFSANIVVRGGSPGDNRYYYDDMELPFVFHLGGLGSVVPLQMLTGVDLYAGGFSSLYPDATSAIVQLRSDSSVPERFSGEAELSLIQSSVYVEGNAFGDDSEENKGAIGYRAGFRRSYLELFGPILADASGNASIVTLPQITDYQFVLNGDHQRGTWQFYLLGAANRLKVQANTGLAENAEGTSDFSLFNYFQTSGIRYSLNIAQGLGLSLTPQQTFVIIEQRFFDNVINVRLNSFSLKTELTRRFGRTLTVSLGVRPIWEFTSTEVDAIQIPAGGFTPFFDPDTAPRNQEDRKREVTAGSAYVDVVYEPVDGLSINPGVIYQRGNNASQEEVDPRAATRWEIKKVHALKAAWGLYSQRPNPAFDSPEYGNPNLKLERSEHYVLGWEYAFSRSWSSDLQVYHKDLWNFVGPNLRAPQERYANSIRGRASGAEVLLKKNPSGRWDGWLSYGYSVSERKDPQNGEWRLSDFDKTHAIVLTGKYKVTGRWTLGAKAEYLTGPTYTHIDGGSFNQNTGRYRPEVAAFDGAIDVNDKRDPDYFQLDLRSDYDVWFDTWSYQWFIELLTSPLGANVVGARWAPDYSQREYIRGLPVIPNVGIKAKF